MCTMYARVVQAPRLHGLLDKLAAWKAREYSTRSNCLGIFFQSRSNVRTGSAAALAWIIFVLMLDA
jgi:hypothetical protein